MLESKNVIAYFKHKYTKLELIVNLFLLLRKYPKLGGDTKTKEVAVCCEGAAFMKKKWF